MSTKSMARTVDRDKQRDYMARIDRGIGITKTGIIAFVETRSISSRAKIALIHLCESIIDEFVGANRDYLCYQLKVFTNPAPPTRYDFGDSYAKPIDSDGIPVVEFRLGDQTMVLKGIITAFLFNIDTLFDGDEESARFALEMIVRVSDFVETVFGENETYSRYAKIVRDPIAKTLALPRICDLRSPSEGAPPPPPPPTRAPIPVPAAPVEQAKPTVIPSPTHRVVKRGVNL